MLRAIRTIQLLLLDRTLPTKRRRAPRKVQALPESDSSLKMLWCELRLHYFPDRPELDEYTVFWSNRRQKRVLGSCSIQKKAVRIAKELADPLHARWLSPLLYHEMCHAALGILPRGLRGKRAWHGNEFKALVARHPDTRELEQWIYQGGWRKAVRRNRAIAALIKF